MAPKETKAILYGGTDRLPYFEPGLDCDPLPAAVTDLRRAIHSSDAILFCTPEYAGGLPGSFKNLLDWTIGDDQPGSIYQKHVAWINASAAPTRATDAYESLEKVLAYAHAAVVRDACVSIPITRQSVDPEGLVSAPTVRSQIAAAVTILVSHSICLSSDGA